MAQRLKVSVSLDKSVLEAVDREAADRCSGRSAVVERIVRSWMRHRKRQELDEAIEAYYRTRPPGEEAEDAAWAELGESTLQDVWNDS